MVRVSETADGLTARSDVPPRPLADEGRRAGLVMGEKGREGELPTARKKEAVTWLRTGRPKISRPVCGALQLPRCTLRGSTAHVFYL